MRRATLSVRAPPVTKEMERFSVFSLSSFGENETSEHSLNTTFSVCIPSLNPPAQKSHNQTKRMLKKKRGKQATAAKYTHKEIHFGDIYNHSVRKKGNEGVLYYGQP